MSPFLRCSVVFLIATSLGCAAEPADTISVGDLALPDEADQVELPVGDFDGEKSDSSTWGAATTCKPIPVVEPLVDPAITISLDGLTLHLVDRAGTYDRVFPIGPGGFENGVSLTPTSENRPDGLFWARLDRPAAIASSDPSKPFWAWNEQCRFWWTDETGKKIPVFAGLPFIRLEGPSVAAYGIHGPIDNFTAPNGGVLRRGFVSHGCIRTAAADILEVYGRIAGKKVPVRIQKAVEKTDAGAGIDLPARFVMSECAADADCNFPGGLCKVSPYSGRGFCTRACTTTCPDKTGFATTFCIKDPADATKGFCTVKPSPLNGGCRRFDGLIEATSVPRFDGLKTSPACIPGSEGWIGDRCLSSVDCLGGRICRPTDGGPAGICTTPCLSSCADQAGGYAPTFCIADPDATTSGICTARCSTNDDCAVGTTCEAEPRFGKTTPIRSVCLPY
ncbi:MAG: L,D-transpeptidase [Myxococcales bacterium]|nr:L,D-transpeptidase [Myxococcales bacterium]